jgi:hypothetical protein
VVFGSMVDNLQVQSSAFLAPVFRGLSPAHHTIQSTHVGSPAAFPLPLVLLAGPVFVGHQWNVRRLVLHTSALPHVCACVGQPTGPCLHDCCC